MNLEQLAKKDLKDIVYKQQKLIFSQQEEIKSLAKEKNKKPLNSKPNVKKEEQHSEIQMSVEISPNGEIVYLTIKSIFTTDISYKLVKQYYKNTDYFLILDKFDIDLNNKEVSVTNIYKNNDYWNIQYKCKEINKVDKERK